MNWNSKTRLEHPLYLSYTEQVIDTVDLSSGFFCGTHNYVSFFAWNEGTTLLSSCTVCDMMIAWSSYDVLSIRTLDEETRDVTIYRFRGKIHPEQLMPNPFQFDRSIEFLRRERGGEVLQHLMKRLQSTCNCPSLVTGEHLSYFGDTGERLAERMNETLEGVLEDIRVSCPFDGRCSETDTTVWDMIQHLNDYHRWSRERVADWLETLDVDLSFPVPKEPGEK